MRSHAPPGAASLRRALGTPRSVALWVFGTVALFATGVGPRPHGSASGIAYDLVLYNAVYLLGAAACWWTARDRPGERSPGRWLAVAFLLSAAGNVVYTVLLARMAEPPYPSVADLLYLLYYPLVYVAFVRVARARLSRVRASMWLDGLIGASGAAALAIAVLLAPALNGVEGTSAELVTNLAYPVADVLLLALLVGVGGVLGLRSDRAMAMARWWARGDENPVSVNLSAANVSDLDLPAKVAAALERHGLPPRALTVEARPDLHHRPRPRPRAAAIVEHTVALAHALGVRLVAEGVEDLATFDVLAALGCDVAQGYAIARPMPVEDFLVWLADRPSRVAVGPEVGRGRG